MDFTHSTMNHHHSRNTSSSLVQLQTFKVSIVKDLIKSLALTKMQTQTKSMKQLPKVFYKDDHKPINNFAFTKITTASNNMYKTK